MIDGISAQISSVNTSKMDIEVKAAKDVSLKADEGNTKKSEDLIDNVVARSEDGDTLQENAESVKALSEGMMFIKDSSNNQSADLTAADKEDESAAKIMIEQREAMAKRMADIVKSQKKDDSRDAINSEKTEAVKEQKEYNAEVKNEEKIESLIGMTKSEVERLYRQGKISKKQYDDNMEVREERTEESINDTAVKDMTQEALKGEKVSQTIEDIYKAGLNDRADLAAQIFN